MTARTITVKLTEAQYGALADAIAVRDAEDEGLFPGELDRGLAQARANAWTKINRAWHDRGRA